jgi:hypothetical protein
LAESVGGYALDGVDARVDSRQWSEEAVDLGFLAGIPFLAGVAFLSLNFLLRLKRRPLGRHPSRTLPLSPENIFEQQ